MRRRGVDTSLADVPTAVLRFAYQSDGPAVWVQLRGWLDAFTAVLADRGLGYDDARAELGRRDASLSGGVK